MSSTHYCTLVVLTACLIMGFSVFAQDIQWEQHYGGSDTDYALSAHQTIDGGYIMAGASQSEDYDVSENYGDNDYWIVKVDPLGQIEWENNYGGSSGEIASSIQQTADGGYIVVGASQSDDYDVTGNYGDWDYWLLKLDVFGAIQWEQNYGGSGADRAAEVVQARDGGYVMAGSSDSDDHDVSGNYGEEDYWVVRVDTVGTIEWEQHLGGSARDLAYSIRQTDDGGYIVVGSSVSSDQDVSMNYGKDDYWLVKLDSTGNIQWEDNYGGSEDDNARSVRQTDDGGYVVVGSTASTDIDVSKNNGTYDCWVLKLNSTGNLQWEESYGGSYTDIITGSSQLAVVDGGYLIAVQASSPDYDVTNPILGWDYWVLHIDSLGAIHWEHSYGGTDLDFPRAVLQTSDGGYLIVGYSGSKDHDVSGNYGATDSWIIKLDNTVGIQQTASSSVLSVYPNPTKGIVTIDLGATAQSGELVVLNTLGETVQKKQFQNCRSINTEIEGPTGLYLIQIFTDGNDTAILKVFKQ